MKVRWQMEGEAVYWQDQLQEAQTAIDILLASGRLAPNECRALHISKGALRYFHKYHNMMFGAFVIGAASEYPCASKLIQ